MSPGFGLATALTLVLIGASIAHAIRAGTTTLLAVLAATALAAVLAMVFYDASSFADAGLPSPTQIALGGLFWATPGAIVGEVRRARRMR